MQFPRGFVPYSCSSIYLQAGATPPPTIGRQNQIAMTSAFLLICDREMLADSFVCHGRQRMPHLLAYRL